MKQVREKAKSTEGAPENTGMQARVTALVEEIIDGTELYMVEVLVRGVPGSHVVDVYLDSDAGINLDECATVSRELGFLLDADDLFPAKYRLNVSSPGTARPLSDPRQFRKNVGRVIRLWYEDEQDERKQTEGELTGVSDDGIEVSRVGADTLFVAFDKIGKAKIKLPW